MRLPWTAEDDAVLTALYATLSASEIAAQLERTRSAVKNRVNKLGLKKAGATNAGRFTPGHASWNAGKKGWQSGGRSAETHFKPGSRNGRAAQLYQPIGAERISKEGYLQRKVNDDMPLQRRWKSVHIILWEQHHGPVPHGHAVAFRNGDHTDIRIDNLECISRGELMARNTVHNYPPELRQLIRLKGAISKRIATRVKKEQQP